MSSGDQRRLQRRSGSTILLLSKAPQSGLLRPPAGPPGLLVPGATELPEPEQNRGMEPLLFHALRPGNLAGNAASPSLD